MSSTRSRISTAEFDPLLYLPKFAANTTASVERFGVEARMKERGMEMVVDVRWSSPSLQVFRKWEKMQAKGEQVESDQSESSRSQESSYESPIAASSQFSVLSVAGDQVRENFLIKVVIFSKADERVVREKYNIDVRSDERMHFLYDMLSGLVKDEKVSIHYCSGVVRKKDDLIRLYPSDFDSRKLSRLGGPILTFVLCCEGVQLKAEAEN